MSEDQRRAFACPPATGHHGDLVLDHLDPDDEDDRRVLIEAEHPEYAAALEDDREVIGPDGSTMQPRLHIAVHEVVANRLWADDPPELWQTAKRLSAAGYDRHEVLHMLAPCPRPSSGTRYAARTCLASKCWPRWRRSPVLGNTTGPRGRRIERTAVRIAGGAGDRPGVGIR